MSPQEAMDAARDFLVKEGFPAEVLSKSNSIERYPNHVARVAKWLARHPANSQRVLCAFRRVGCSYFKLQMLLALAILAVDDPAWPDPEAEFVLEVDVEPASAKHAIPRRYGIRRGAVIRQITFLN